MDGDHVEIEATGGAYELLDTVSGTAHATPRGEIFWCESLPIMDVTAPSGSPANIRVATHQYFGCSAKGTKVSGLPSTQQPSVGVKVPGRFFWSTSKGIAGAPARVVAPKQCQRKGSPNLSAAHDITSAL